MSCVISKEIFDNLKIGSEIRDKEEKVWTVTVANCGGPGKYTTHLFITPPLGEHEYVFHDGISMCFSPLNASEEHHGAICGDFETLS